MRQSESKTEDAPSVHDRLHSAPKGLLRYYILHKIAQKPIHGYEIIQDIDSKTEAHGDPAQAHSTPSSRNSSLKASSKQTQNHPTRLHAESTRSLRKVSNHSHTPRKCSPTSSSASAVYDASSSNSSIPRTWPLSSLTDPTGNSRWPRRCSNPNKTRSHQQT